MFTSASVVARQQLGVCVKVFFSSPRVLERPARSSPFHSRGVSTAARSSNAMAEPSEAGGLMPVWSCKKDSDKFNICGDCYVCVLSDKLHVFSQWMEKAGEASKRRFFTGILMRCGNLLILENLKSVLQGTAGKDFTYARSRPLPSKPEEDIWSMYKALDEKQHGMDLLETWEWFKNSPNWIKMNYLLQTLSFCEAPFLQMLGNVVHILIVWERRNVLQFGSDEPRFSVDRLDPSFQKYTYHETFKLRQTDFSKHKIPVQNSEASGKTRKPLESVREDLRLYVQDTWKRERKGVDSDSDASDDPALSVIPRSSKSLAGVCRYRDFIRRLPVHVSKKIFGLLDTASLRSCKQVSRLWQSLSKEVLFEMEVKKNVEAHAKLLQGSSTSRLNPAYAKICEVLVPATQEEAESSAGQTSSTLKATQRKDLDSLFKDVNTTTVVLEERNVYCGVYDITVLLDSDDPNRAMHYPGGQLMAIGFQDRTIRFLDVGSQQLIPPVIQGHVGSVKAVLVCVERNLVISGSYDLSIRCWNLKTGACMMVLHGHSGTISCLDLYEDRIVSGAKDGKVKVWSLKTKKCLEEMKFKHLKPVTCVKMDDSLVVSGCSGGLVKMWSLETASLVRHISGHQGAVSCLCLEKWHILSGGSDGLVKVWSRDHTFKKCLVTFQHPKEVLTMSFRFLRVITGCADGKVRIFNFLSGDCLRAIKININQSPILSLFAHHNTIVVNTRDRVLMLQFAEVEWDYSSSVKRESYSSSSGSAQEVRAKSRSSGRPHTQDSLQESKTSARSIHQRNRPSIKQPRKHLSSISEYKDFQARVKRATSSSDKESHDAKMAALGRSEKACRDRMRTRGLHHPMSLDFSLLRANSSQHGLYTDTAKSNMELNARIRDAWGPCLRAREPPSCEEPPPRKTSRPTQALKMAATLKNTHATTHKFLDPFGEDGECFLRTDTQLEALFQEITQQQKRS